MGRWVLVGRRARAWVGGRERAGRAAGGAERAAGGRERTCGGCGGGGGEEGRGVAKSIGACRAGGVSGVVWRE